ncbi:hypothetical protein [Nodosilinea sp. FACHB-141]|uniref:Uncharacterized protein n=1 Tax=Leptolyngbya subtilissima DQ-A4 TaxID=2933933 RepID=A0ABV0KBP2_9CYAN|nr:hypothetical protein [Nodosilinea sp. FACHB-141]
MPIGFSYASAAKRRLAATKVAHITIKAASAVGF